MQIIILKIRKMRKSNPMSLITENKNIRNRIKRENTKIGGPSNSNTLMIIMDVRKLIHQRYNLEEL